MADVSIQHLGVVPYEDALHLQEDLVVQRQEGAISDQVLLLEHEGVYTIGRTQDQSSLKSREQLPYAVHEINRGGQATFHGPGQLVGYFIFDLHGYKKDLHHFLRWVEDTLIVACADMEIEASRREGLTGVWVGERKLASIGVGVKKWVTMHGFAINVGSDLSGFEAIVPCGIDQVEMTSISKELKQEVEVPVVAELMGEVLKERLQEL